MFYTSVTMVIAATPHVAVLQITFMEIKSLYTFLEGDRVARPSGSPPPTVKVLLDAERAMWREISILIHKGSNLREAMETVRGDATFWHLHVYNKPTVPLHHQSTRVPAHYPLYAQHILAAA